MQKKPIIHGADHLLGGPDPIVGLVTSTDASVTIDTSSGGYDLSAPGGGSTTRVLEFVIDGGGTLIATGVAGDFSVPFAATILDWTLLADRSGSIVVNVWKDVYANYPPTVADKITASAPPTISTATKATSATLTSWTTAISAGDTLRFNVDSVTTIRRVTLALKITVP